jgi:hypothetical protein
MTEDVPESVNENRIMLKNKGLLILREALWYCENNNTIQVQFSELKRLCNETLCLISEGNQTDMGGSFNMILKRLEGKDDPKKRYLQRDIQSSKKSFIIPDIEKIRNLLESKGLIELKEDEYSSFPPMEKPVLESIPTYFGYSRIPNPSDKIKVYRDWRQSAVESTVYKTDLLSIFVINQQDKALELNDDNLQELIQFGKRIAEEDDLRPFQIILEYKGRPSLIVSKGDTETFSP